MDYELLRAGLGCGRLGASGGRAGSLLARRCLAGRGILLLSHLLEPLAARLRLPAELNNEIVLAKLEHLRALLARNSGCPWQDITFRDSHRHCAGRCAVEWLRHVRH